jgi:hypothetical protein
MMKAQIKKDYRWNTLVAFGVEFVKYEPRQVPVENEVEAKCHPNLDVFESESEPTSEPTLEPVKKAEHEKRSRK